jgi:hypothetical protein
MLEIFKFIIGVCVLILGVLLGNFLRNQTKEEINLGRKYFNILIWISLIGGFIGFIVRNDVLLFSFFFIAIVTSRSLVKDKIKGKKKNVKN